MFYHIIQERLLHRYENSFAFDILHVFQSKILRKGDQILKVNGIDVRRLTCDQIAKILRLAVYNNGYALLQISRKKRCEEGKLSSVSKDENGNFRYCHPINDDLTTSNNDTTLSVSFSDMTGSSEPVIYAQVRNNSLNI
ncbi:unnamed protein product [Onchocerca flexuosa]|uniref:PDZ domain-containing protein n=1 Tax=Onchocerca flexuosa TaxID=387005 RepID=A0A183HIK6_9BILA|nr:unnamed protein product [Onchocerca flexuosa]